MARDVTGFDGALQTCRYLIHDRDTKFSAAFEALLESSGIKPIRLPPRSPNLNAFAERFVRSIKDECLTQFVLFGEKSLRYVIREYLEHYHTERNHQGLENMFPFPDDRLAAKGRKIKKAERLGGLLNFYHRPAA